MARVAAIALVVAVIGGCGGDGATTSSSSAAGDLLVYAERLAAATGQYQVAVGRLDPSPDADAGEVFTAVANQTQAYIGWLSSLEPPAEVSRQHQLFVAALGDHVAFLLETSGELAGVSLAEMAESVPDDFQTEGLRAGLATVVACRGLQDAVTDAGQPLSLACFDPAPA